MKSGYALITGASGGIGRDLADCFAADGVPLILVARSEDKLKVAQADIAKKYAVDVRIYTYDLSKSGSAQQLFEQANSEKLPVSFVVNNAGFGDKADVRDADTEKLQNMVRLNIEALVVLSKLYGSKMAAAKNGKIVNIASVAGLIPGPGMAVYYATKAFVISFSQALAKELEPYGVKVTTICPGATKTGFAAAAGAGSSRLFSGKLPSSKQLAVFTYKAMKSEKQLVIWGIKNRLLARIVSLLPRRTVLSVVRKVQ